MSSSVLGRAFYLARAVDRDLTEQVRIGEVRADAAALQWKLRQQALARVQSAVAVGLTHLANPDEVAVPSPPPAQRRPRYKAPPSRGQQGRRAARPPAMSRRCQQLTEGSLLMKSGSPLPALVFQDTPPSSAASDAGESQSVVTQVTQSTQSDWKRARVQHPPEDSDSGHDSDRSPRAEAGRRRSQRRSSSRRAKSPSSSSPARAAPVMEEVPPAPSDWPRSIQQLFADIDLRGERLRSTTRGALFDDGGGSPGRHGSRSPSRSVELPPLNANGRRGKGLPVDRVALEGWRAKLSTPDRGSRLRPAVERFEVASPGLRRCASSPSKRSGGL